MKTGCLSAPVFDTPLAIGRVRMPAPQKALGKRQVDQLVPPSWYQATARFLDGILLEEILAI